MKRKKLVIVLSVALVSVLLLMMTLSGCGRNDLAAEPVESDLNIDPIIPNESAEPLDATADTVRQDGERFEAVIMLEGMEETVRYEHVRNETAGFELDYDYEMLERRGESNSECFVSRYDDPDDPENYLEVTYSAEDADTATEAVNAALLNDFDTVVMEPYTLDRAGSCVRISASDAKGGGVKSNSLRTVYIIPAVDGCRVATIHCTIESAEGFGARFSDIINTLSVINR